MLGLDVSKSSLDLALVDPVTRRQISHQKIANDAGSIDALIASTDPAIPWVVEPTGRYSHCVVKLAQGAGRQVLLAGPRAAKLFLKSYSPRAKTDKLDAYGLALFALSRPLPPFTLKSYAVEKLDQLLSARKGLSHSRQRLKLQRLELPHAADALGAAIDAIGEQIVLIDKQIRQHTDSYDEFALVKTLMQVPGIGPVTASAVASRLLSRSFSSPDAFVAYMGLDVAVRDSGRSVGRRKLTKQGDAELRRLLYLAAMANLSCKSSVFKDRYSQERQKGRKTTAALNIIARKIAHVCWALQKHGGPFDPQKVYKSIVHTGCQE